MATKKKILFLAANPEGTIPGDLDKQSREIREKIGAADYRETLEIIAEFAVRPDDVEQLLLSHKPHVVHFTGHGTFEDEVILEGTDNKPHPLTKDALSGVLTVLRDNIQLVLLVACYTKPQAEAITQVIDCAIGMNAAIRVEEAIVFSASFYRALGFGRSVEDAFELGKNALRRENFPGDTTPELLVRDGVDASQLFIVRPEPLRSPPSTVSDQQQDSPETNKPASIRQHVSGVKNITTGTGNINIKRLN